jgi:hypothetical protein
VPADATHLVLSVGDNDALGNSDFLGAPARSAAEALSALADIGDEFERGYLAMLANVLARGLPTAICTVYYPRFADAALQKVAVAALTLFNDSIVRAAVAHSLPLLDLRLICTGAGDYANPIEPSAWGGEKIARAIAEVVDGGPVAGRAGFSPELVSSLLRRLKGVDRQVSDAPHFGLGGSPRDHGHGFSDRKRGVLVSATLPYGVPRTSLKGERWATTETSGAACATCRA